VLLGVAVIGLFGWGVGSTLAGALELDADVEIGLENWSMAVAAVVAFLVLLTSARARARWMHARYLARVIQIRGAVLESK
jgi:hypothetical protein